MKNILFMSKIRNLLIRHSREFIEKHRHHHHLALATLALVIASTGIYAYRHEIAQAATYTFTQSSWAGGITANTATHASNQSNWTQYSATSTSLTAGAGGVSLPSTSRSITDDGFQNTFATSNGPKSIVFDQSGNLYARYSTTVDKVTPSGTRTTFATVGDRPYQGNHSQVFDTAGNLYTANYTASTVSKVTPGGTVTTFATVGTNPYALTFDTAGNLYTANYTASTVSKVTPGGTVTTFATVGTGPLALAFDTAGNLYTVNLTANTVSKVTPGGTVTTFATVGSPYAFAFDTSDNLYVARNGPNIVSKITPGGTVTTFATVVYPYALAFDTSGNLYVGTDGNSIIKLLATGGFEAGTFSSTVQTGSGSAASVGIIPTGTLTALSPATVATGSNPDGYSAISPDGTSVYVTNYMSANMSMYSRNTSTGALTALSPATIAIAGNPEDVTVSPDGISVYVNSGSNVYMFSRNTSTGLLTALGTPTITGGTRGIAVSSDGTSVYSVHSTNAVVHMYSRNTSTGALTALGTPTIATGTGAWGVTVSPDGTSVYVVNSGAATVSMYSRNISTGALTALGTPTIASGTTPYYITISPDSTSVYVSNSASNTISMYSRNTSTGALAALGTPTIATGAGPRNLAVSPDGNNVYISSLTSAAIYLYSRNTSTGALTAFATPTIAAGTQSASVTISPDGTSVYVANYGSNTVSMYSRSMSHIAYGGIMSYDGAYTVHTFTSGTSTFTTTGTISSLEYLVVGGGGGTSGEGGGGGAGGYQTGTLTNIAGPITVVVGAGGAGSGSYSPPTGNGRNSVFSSITSLGGGSGGSGNGADERVGGSGGGHSGNTNTAATGAAGTAGQGYAGGGATLTPNYAAGGGGGAGGVGSTANGAPGGNGGVGLSSAISGTTVFYAGGGGGGIRGGTVGTGGNGGGGNGSNGTTAPTSGTPNTGGGGGGGAWSNGVSANGGSGIVIVKYLALASSGTFTSAVIDASAAAGFTTLAYTSTLNGQTLTVDARAGNIATPDGTWTAWQTGISSGGSIAGLAGNRYIQYRANLSTTNAAVTPTLDSVTINYNQYSTSGDITSSKYDAESSASLISNVLWSASNTSASEVVKLQVRSSPDGATWSNWCGSSITCDGTDYFTVSTGVVGGLSTSHPLRLGSDDRYLQYKAFLTSGGSATPTITSITVQYVVNGPPVITNITASQGSSGAVTVGYDVADSDNGIGNIVDVTLQYCTTNCSTGTEVWADAVTVSGHVGTGVALGVGKSITWTPSTDYASQYKVNTQTIRIKVNDRDAANNLGYGTSNTFTLDTTAPVVVANLNSSGTQDVVNITATDSSTIEYRLCNTADFATCATWTSVTSGIATPVNWSATGAPNAETVYLQVRDQYGNVTAPALVAPAMPANFGYSDISNTSTNTYREFLNWASSTPATFGSYKVYHSTDGSTYSLLATVADQAQNYYIHTITSATSSTQYYKVTSVSSNGDISNYTAVQSDVPDGSGGIDVTAPYIPFAGIAAPTVGNSSANITFSTYTDNSMTTGELATSTVRYASYTGGAPTSCPSATNSVSTGTYTVNHSIYLTGLTPATSYVFCVLARDITGNVSSASLVSAHGGTFTTVSGPVISNVTEREITDTSATIFWNTNTSSDSKVYYAVSTAGVNGSTPATGSIVTVAGTDGAYQHQVGLTGLTSGQTYYYKVVSTDAGALSSTDNNSGQYFSFVTLRDTTPPTITGTSTPVLSSSAAVIVWQTDELATNQVFYDTTSRTGNTAQYLNRTAIEPTMSIFHVATLSAATSRYDNITNSLVTGGNALLPETLYYVTVKSVDAAGNGTSSGEWSFTTPSTGAVTVTIISSGARKQEGETPDTTPPSISNVTVSDITPFGAAVGFVTNEETVSGVDFGKDTSYNSNTANFNWGTSHSVILRGLTLGTEYHLRVKAIDKAGNTGTSGDQTFKTSFLTENLKDLAKIENIEQFQREIEDTIESILPSLVPPFVSKPAITDITEAGATISFRTNIKAFPVVVYADDGSYDTTKDNPYTGEVSDTTEKTLDHSLNLTGLKGNTKYHVQARAFSLPKVLGKSADITFITKASKIAGSIVERKKDSFTVVWTTDQPTSSIVEYRNVKSGITERKTDDAKKTSHSMKIENLPSGVSYEVNLSGATEQGNVAEAGSSLSVTTSRDVTPPAISGFKVDNALVPGRTDRIQTIVSWVTDEPSNSTVYYEEGAGTAGDTAELANKNEALDSYIVNHSVILPNLKPGTIYRLKVTSSDDSDNLGSFGPRTVITPRQTESITDIIFKNFEDSFKFLRKI